MTIKNTHDKIISSIEEWIDGKHNLVVVEIGVWFAYNASFCLPRWGHHFQEWHLIDPYMQEEYHSVFNNNRVEHKSYAKKILAPYEDKCVWVEDYSYNVINNYEDDSVDLLYIDGNHSYDAVLQDITLYYPKVKTGGMIIFDDYNEEGVKKAIDEFLLAKSVDVLHTTESFPSHAYFVK